MVDFAIKVSVLNITTGREGVLARRVTRSLELVLEFGRSAQELIFVTSGRSTWTEYIRKEARESVRAVLFRACGKVRSIVRLDRLVVYKIC